MTRYSWREMVTGAIGMLLLALAGCKPDAPSVAIKTDAAPKTDATSDTAKPLQIPKITADSASPDTPDSPPAPAPDTLNSPATEIKNAGAGSKTETKSVEPQSLASDSTKKPTPAVKNKVVPAIAKLAAPERSVYTPRVTLSEGHKKLCLVNVGDTLPELTLSNLEGQSVNLPTYYGEKLTIVVFWNAGRISANEQFERMKTDILHRYGVAGVSILAVNVGNSLEEVQAITASTPPSFPVLLDTNGEAFQKVAVDKLPRTYVLDGQGKVLWFDIEYSRTTRRELENAIHYFLKDAT